MNAETQKIIERSGKSIRAASIRSYWRRAKSLAPSITDRDLRGWWHHEECLAIQARCFEHLGGMPSHPISRIQFLTKVRDSFIKSRDGLAALRVDAAIWREVERIRFIKALERFCRSLARRDGSAVVLRDHSAQLQAAE